MGTLNIETLRDIAERRDAIAAGIPTSTFHEWKRDRYDLSATQMIALAGAIGFDVVLADKPAPPAPSSGTHCPCCCPHAHRPAGASRPAQARGRYAED